MLQQISLREANQHLSRYIDMVEDGEEVVITRRGEPVARLLSISKKRQLTTVQQQALKRLLARANKGYKLGCGKFDREAAHER